MAVRRAKRGFSKRGFSKVGFDIRFLIRFAKEHPELKIFGGSSPTIGGAEAIAILRKALKLGHTTTATVRSWSRVVGTRKSAVVKKNIKKSRS
jgi:hypothetical protein